MSDTLAFDIYGTLIDTQGITGMLEKHAGQNSGAFSLLWRQKQLEYSFRRGLMQLYRDFGVCTVQALDYALLTFGIFLSPAEKNELLETYRALPVFEDVTESLEQARNAGFRVFAFSNGKPSDIEQLLVHAGIREFFIDIISVDEVQSFKPDPAVYRHFLEKTASKPEHAWLVSSNPFDILGAVAVKMKAVWVQRSPSIIMDPWEFTPTLTVKKMNEMTAAILSWKNRQGS